jgi:hypothetical protein
VKDQERAQRLAMAIQHIKSKILAVEPGSSDVGGIFDAYGEAIWTPSRAPGLDFSSWGDWEAWEHQRQKEGHPGELEPSGEWVCWHAPTGQYFAYTKFYGNPRSCAETFCVGMNASGKRTRVVMANGSWRASAVKVTDEQRGAVAAKVAEEMSTGEGI